MRSVRSGMAKGGYGGVRVCARGEGHGYKWQKHCVSVGRKSSSSIFAVKDFRSPYSVHICEGRGANVCLPEWWPARNSVSGPCVSGAVRVLRQRPSLVAAAKAGDQRTNKQRGQRSSQ
jgi:hypothetical protein